MKFKVGDRVKITCFAGFGAIIEILNGDRYWDYEVRLDKSFNIFASKISRVLKNIKKRPLTTIFQ